MTIRTTLVNRLRRATLRAQLTMLYAGLLVVVVAVVLVAAAFLFRTASRTARRRNTTTAPLSRSARRS